jgi:hypothetical protein
MEGSSIIASGIFHAGGDFQDCHAGEDFLYAGLLAMESCSTFPLCLLLIERSLIIASEFFPPGGISTISTLGEISMVSTPGGIFFMG